MASIFEFAAIDPLALLLPGPVYVRLVEKLHPHVPKIAEIAEAAKGMTPEEKAFAIARAKTLVAYGQAVQEALK
jgi:hypothetical protein